MISKPIVWNQPLEDFRVEARQNLHQVESELRVALWLDCLNGVHMGKDIQWDIGRRLEVDNTFE